MQSLHIANTCFEWELTQSQPPKLIDAIERSAVYLQLQFLPFLYADERDGVCVSARPSDDFWRGLEKLKIRPPKLHLLAETQFSIYDKVKSWGPSLSVAKWAEERSLQFNFPGWDLVKKVNSKLFSSTVAPQFADAKLFYNETGLWEWLRNGSNPKVFKTSFGVSGKGHFIWDP